MAVDAQRLLYAGIPFNRLSREFFNTRLFWFQITMLENSLNSRCFLAPSLIVAALSVT